MKTNNTLRLFSSVLFVLLMVGCKPEKKKEKPVRPETPQSISQVYVLCQGVWGMNNSTLYNWNVKEEKSTLCLFTEKNGRGLGDTGNDMELYGGKLYVVMNVSNTVEVVDVRTGVSLKQIPMVNGDGTGRQPRYACSGNGKVYVCAFDGSVSRIDTASLEIDALATAGRSPDGICRSNGKIYVSNSGGMDYPNYDRTVSVIDENTFTLVATVEVGLNPYRMGVDKKGNVYVCTRGDYGQTCGNFYRINSRTDQVDKTFDIPVQNFCMVDNMAYCYYSDNNGGSRLGVLDLDLENWADEDFVSDGTQVQTPYFIAEYAGDIYVGDAKDYVSSGNVYCFTKEGKCRYKLENVGLLPAAMAVLAD